MGQFFLAYNIGLGFRETHISSLDSIVPGMDVQSQWVRQLLLVGQPHDSSLSTSRLPKRHLDSLQNQFLLCVW